MTQSVADKTPIPDKAWRRHTDPPLLWIAVATISITLHLLIFLIFWLLRSYSYSLSQRSSSNPIPVDFVEISSQRKAPSKAKPVSPKKPSTTEKSPVVRSPKTATQENLTAKSTSVGEDSNAIALATPNEARTSQPQTEDTTQQSSKRRVIEQEETQPLSQPLATSEPTRQSEPSIAKTPEQTQPEPSPEPTPEITPQAQQSEPTPDPTTLADNPDTQNQANQEFGEQTQASNPQNNTTDSTRTDSSPKTTEQPQPSHESTSPRQPDDQVIVGKGTPLEDIAQPVKPEQSPLDEPKGGRVALATWQIEADAVKKDIQDHPPQIVGDIKEKELNSLALNRELGGDQPIEFKAVLIVDSEGNLNSIFLDPKIPEPQKTQYKEYAEEIFKGQKFIPASNNNGSKPDLGELVVNIRIQRKSERS
ncbi:MAG: hypothetical protein KME30_30840 [Iphinoe sp. HA4291-MV1]|jgi:hypothetical protein|nr:hypothetical protein [Iphinoe sp. HA4291-MV1]